MNGQAPSTTSAGRLQRILQLERDRGCADRTVIGGLDSLLRNLLAREAPGNQAPVLSVTQSLQRRSYAGMDLADRRAWLDRAIRLLADIAAREQAGSPAQRRTEHRPPVGPALAARVQAVHDPHQLRVAADTTDRQQAEALATRASQRATAATQTAPESRKVSPAAKRAPSHGLDSPVTVLPRVGANRAELLGRLGITSVRDLLFHFPHRHDDYSKVVRVSDLCVGEPQTVVVRIWSASVVGFGPSRRKSSELIAGDETGNVRVIFFNNPYPAAAVRTNQRVTLSGKVSVFGGQRQFENPDYEVVEEGGDLDNAIHTGRLVPVYPLTQGIQNRALRAFVRTALDLYADKLDDHLPDNLRQRRGLQDLQAAVRQAHYPNDYESLERARQRLAYDELLTLQLSVVARKARRATQIHATRLPLAVEQRQRFTHSLPFTLTGAQHRAIDALLADVAGSTPMARLLQGDVGSGKTVVAATALLAAAANGRQAVLMAPTEILAEQHFRTLCTLFGAQVEASDVLATARQGPGLPPLRLALLRGGLKARAKREVQEAIATGDVDIAVGTQALIQAGVSFERLALTIVDEQHRFGVEQRTALTEKGSNAHLLVMTATPIPRTLALSLYGDLDISVIDEMPAGRRPVRTKALQPHQRDYAYRFIRDQIGRGFQAFVICPLVEESEARDVRAAIDEYARLSSEVFPDLPMSLLHGRMAPSEKETVMTAFRDQETSILVSTAVVEVGIDIPKATVIMIEGAERFGLAQLHQFRGRVGRSGDQSYCLLLSESPSQEARQRLALLEETQDGFKLAEEDLKLRGPGDYFGTRQSGLPTLRQARLTDTAILESARADALELIARDPSLSGTEFAALRGRVEALTEKAGEAN